MRKISYIIIGLFFLSIAVWGAIPQSINVQGVMMDLQSNVLPNTTKDITFKFYTQMSGGIAFFTKTLSVTSDEDGIYGVIIDQIPDTINFNDPYFLELDISGIGTLTPRQPFTAVPYSLNSAKLGGIPAQTIINNITNLSTQGATGSIWYSGTGNPNLPANRFPVAKNNDFYLETTTGQIFKYDNTNPLGPWMFVMQLLVSTPTPVGPYIEKQPAAPQTISNQRLIINPQFDIDRNDLRNNLTLKMTNTSISNPRIKNRIGLLIESDDINLDIPSPAVGIGIGNFNGNGFFPTGIKLQTNVGIEMSTLTLSMKTMGDGSDGIIIANAGNTIGLYSQGEGYGLKAVLHRNANTNPHKENIHLRHIDNTYDPNLDASEINAAIIADANDPNLNDPAIYAKNNSPTAPTARIENNNATGIAIQAHGKIAYKGAKVVQFQPIIPINVTAGDYDIYEMTINDPLVTSTSIIQATSINNSVRGPNPPLVQAGPVIMELTAIQANQFTIRVWQQKTQTQVPTDQILIHYVILQPLP